ncbi:hypothetical protein [uncultured Helicobacter sp.]|uniref:hypothetical protein n=1 Tax=uncultured Helicobacter sp. TaxID=175537 RepID=UPI0026135E13|nr:hypothetical protein [uncultured Helicobacter sp.]
MSIYGQRAYNQLARFQRRGGKSAHSLHWGQFLSGDFYQFTAYLHRGGYSLGTAYGANYNNLATFKDSNETLEFSGDFILDNLISRDREENTGLIIWFMTRRNVSSSTHWLAQTDFIIYES